MYFSLLVCTMYLAQKIFFSLCVHILVIETGLTNFPILYTCTFIIDLSLINVFGNQIVCVFVIIMKIHHGDKPCT